MATTGTIITVAGYNDIQAKIRTVLSTNYGYPGMRSVPVTTGTIATSLQWEQLYADANRGTVHQTGAQLSISGFPPTNTMLINAAAINAFDQRCAAILASTNTVDPGQLAENTTNGVSTVKTIGVDGSVSGTWGNTRQHRVQHTWIDADYARYFFNLGGRIVVTLGYPPGNYSGQDAIWRDLIDAMNTQLATRTFGLEDFGNNSPVELAEFQNNSTPDGITVRFSRPNNNQTLTEVAFINSSDQPADIAVTSTIKYLYSTELAAGPAAGGVPTTGLPQTTNLIGLDNSTDSGILTVTKILKITPSPIVVSVPSGQTSVTVLTLTNIGNTAMRIGAATAGIPAGSRLAVRFQNQSWTTAALILGPGQSETVELSYYSTTLQGEFNTTLRVAADNDSGVVVTPINITVAPPLFDFVFEPAAITNTATSTSLVTQAFSIVPIGEYDTNFADPILTQDYNYFTISTVNASSDRVSVTFNPQVRKINGTYTATISLTLVGNRSITKTATFTVVRNLNDQSSHLTSWLSPMAPNNSAIGMSYDIIEGQRYITMGVGVQTTDIFSTALIDSINLLSVSNLGINADNKYDAGMVLYAAPSNSAYCQFLNDYGAWIKPNTGEPVGVNISRSYRFTAPVTGYYTWEFAADDVGAFNVDGRQQLNATSSFAVSEKGTIELIAGTHVVNLQILNTVGAAAIAISIQAPSGIEVWNTRNPVRTVDPYAGWSEVCRIPLPSATTGTPAVYQSVYYYIKDTAAAVGDAGYTRWGDYFGTPGGVSARSLFTVNDDGFGNLEVIINGKATTPTNTIINTTVDNLPYSKFYYSTRGTRYTQLDYSPVNANGVSDGTSPYTRVFTGFGRSPGTVTTTIAPYPIPDAVEVTYNGSAAPAPSGGDDNFWEPLIFILLLPIGKIICKKLHELGKLPEDIYQADQAYGAELAAQHPDIYNGYIAWASIVVDWMSGTGPDMYVVSKERLQSWSIDWAEQIATPWAEHMAYKMGSRPNDNIIGKVLMSIGRPISKVVGIWQRRFGKNTKPAGFGTGTILIGVFVVLRAIVALGKLLGKK